MLVAFEVAIELVGELRPVVEEIRAHDGNLALELKQSALRIVVHLVEAQRAGGHQRRALALAHDELREIRTGLERAMRWGYVADCARALRRVDRLTSLCWAPSHARAA